MQPFDVKAHIESANRTQIAVMIGYAIGGALMWYGAYWIAWGITWAIVFLFKFWFALGDPSAWAGPIAWAYLGLLVIEALRYARQVSTENDLAESFFATGYTDTEEERILRSYFASQGYADPVTTGLMIAKITVAAPRWTVNAWRAWKRVVRADDAEVQTAQRLFDRLLAERAWVPLRDVTDHAAALWVLDRSGLLWSRIDSQTPDVRIDNGQAEVRIPADLTHRLYESK